MRIAVYCRVSTNEELQQHSLRQQEEYYRALISFSKEHTLVGIYADTASGLFKKDRPQFNKMIRDCKRGKIDLIVTKSISRFSRNTVEFLKIIRDLKARGVDVWFEIEKILVSKEKGEFNMAIYAAIAEQESRSRSRNTKWGIDVRMKDGTLL